MDNRITTELDIYAIPDSDADDGFRFELYNQSSWVSGDDSIKVGVARVTFAPPQNMTREQMVLKAIETLRDKQDRKRAEAEREVLRLQERINSLLQLTHQPEANSDSNVIEVS